MLATHALRPAAETPSAVQSSAVHTVGRRLDPDPRVGRRSVVVTAGRAAGQAGGVASARVRSDAPTMYDAVRPRGFEFNFTPFAPARGVQSLNLDVNNSVTWSQHQQQQQQQAQHLPRCAVNLNNALLQLLTTPCTRPTRIHPLASHSFISLLPTKRHSLLQTVYETRSSSLAHG